MVGAAVLPAAGAGDVGDCAARVHYDRKLPRRGAQVQGGVEVPVPCQPRRAELTKGPTCTRDAAMQYVHGSSPKSAATSW